MLQGDIEAGEYDFILLNEMGRNRPDFPGFVRFSTGYEGPGVGGARGCGVGVFVRCSLAASVSELWCEENGVWVEVQTEFMSSPLIVSCLYIRPYSMATVSVYKEWFDQIQSKIISAGGRGNVLVVGDFNAHTGSLCDYVDTQGLDEVLGIDDLVASASHILCNRNNQDRKVPNLYGKELIQLCQSTGMVIVNGRTEGDWDGAVTYPGAGSVLDYGLVDSALYQAVRYFRVLSPVGWSDHCPIEMSVCIEGEGKGGVGGSDLEYDSTVESNARGDLPRVRWRSELKEMYGAALDSGDAAVELQAIVDDVSSRRCSPVEAAERMSACAHSTAVAVFGTSGGGRKGGGHRPANPWFKHCKAEWQVLQQAIRRGDTHAAKAYRNTFNTLKRRWKRYYNKHNMAVMLDEYKWNPRRFWKRFKGSKHHEMVHDLRQWSQYWKSLYSGAEGDGLPDHVADFVSELCEDVPLRDQHRATCLNVPVTVEEVAKVLKRLKLGKAPGPDGILPEMLKEAIVPCDRASPSGPKVYRNVLLPVIHAIVKEVFQSGAFPSSWAEAAVSAVFKKGDRAVMDNYRGIAVGNVMGKVFSMILESRLDKWAESEGKRAEGQAGFRKGRRTIDQIFLLRHAIDKYKSQDKSLYCCFVDFRKAYDLVDRKVLMGRLAQMGIWGNMLVAIASMYQRVSMAARVDGVVGPRFISNSGVKQGDPLSPLLFGLLIDGLEEYMKVHAPCAGIDIGGKECRLLFYADDIVLMAESRIQLQRMLDTLHDFCLENRMVVNVDKTKVVVFPKGRGGKYVWSYDGVPVEIVNTFKYLGVEVDSRRGFSFSHEAIRSVAIKAMWGLVKHMREREVTSILLRVELFKTVVMPVMLYGAEIWSGAFCHPHKRFEDHPLQRVQSMFLRQVGGCWLRTSTAVRVLLAEYGCMPVAYSCTQALLRYWDRLLECDSVLLQAAFKENLRMAVMDGNGGVWCSEVLELVRAVDEDYTADVVTAVISDGLVPVMDVDGTLDLWKDIVQYRWYTCGVDPRLAESDDVTCCTYSEWMSEDIKSPGVLAASGEWIHPKYREALLRLRVGSHSLDVCTGRWCNPSTGSKGRIDRNSRVCRVCQSGMVEDEKHFVLECPAYSDIRNMFPDVVNFGGDGSLRNVMCWSSQYRLARFIFELNQRRLVILTENGFTVV